MVNRLLCNLVLLLFSIVGASQNGTWTPMDFPESKFIGIYEVNGKLYGAVSNGFRLNTQSDISYKLSIYEIDHLGNSLGLNLNEIITLQYPDEFTTIALEHIDDGDYWLALQTLFVNSNRHKYRFLKLDKDLAQMGSKSLDSLGHPVMYHFDSFEGRNCLLGSLMYPPKDEILYINMVDTFILPSIYVTQSTPNSIFFITSMEIDRRTGDLLIFYHNGIGVLDTNLHQKQLYNINEIGTGRHGDVIGLSKNYFSHGSTINKGGVIVLQKYDTLFNIIVTDTFGIPNQDNYPFIKNSIKSRNNEILVGGHLSGPLNVLDFPAEKKKFYLAKYDTSLQIKWYKEYGGDQGYILDGLHLMDNGSCFAYGYVTDSLDVRYAYLLYVDQNGDIINEHQIPNVYHPTIKVINPSDGNLTVLNPENLEAEITLYASDGKKLFRSPLGPGTQEFSLTSLPPGIYPYMLMREGRFYGSGKWLKQ